MIGDLRKLLKDVAGEANVETVPTAKVFRHTYATARLQTTDGGKQISLWTVAKELGHKTVARVEDTYGHPSHYRPRGEVVEYRVKREDEE
jgi:integrase